MRTVILVGMIGGKWQPVKNAYGEYVPTLILWADRQIDKLAFHREHLVRLPRRLGVDMYRLGKTTQEPYASNPQLEPPYIASRYFPDGARNINVS